MNAVSLATSLLLLLAGSVSFGLALDETRHDGVEFIALALSSWFLGAVLFFAAV